MAAKRGVKRSSKQRAMVSPEVRRAYTGSAFKASPDRLRERSQMYSDGTSARQDYNRMTYGQADVSQEQYQAHLRGSVGRKERRPASTIKAMQQADASLFNSTMNKSFKNRGMY